MRNIIIFFLIGAICLFIFPGCVHNGEDRCWVNKYQYQQAKKIYEETHTLDLVRRHLESQPEWRECEIDEVIYRLKKEYHLDEDLN